MSKADKQLFLYFMENFCTSFNLCMVGGKMYLTKNKQVIAEEILVSEQYLKRLAE